MSVPISEMIVHKELFAPTKFVPLSDTMWVIFPRLAIILRRAAMKAFVEASLTSSRWIARVSRHTKTEFFNLI